MKRNFIQYFGHVAGIKIEKKNGEILWATKALGTFDTPEEAHEKFKQEHILIYGF
jgi:hypothetical protein